MKFFITIIFLTQIIHNFCSKENIYYFNLENYVWKYEITDKKETNKYFIDFCSFKNNKAIMKYPDFLHTLKKNDKVINKISFINCKRLEYVKKKEKIIPIAKI